MKERVTIDIEYCDKCGKFESGVINLKSGDTDITHNLKSFGWNIDHLSKFLNTYEKNLDSIKITLNGAFE